MCCSSCQRPIDVAERSLWQGQRASASGHQAGDAGFEFRVYPELIGYDFPALL
jgi:hypothetical protein